MKRKTTGPLAAVAVTDRGPGIRSWQAYLFVSTMVFESPRIQLGVVGPEEQAAHTVFINL
jgi:hypothetical protein